MLAYAKQLIDHNSKALIKVTAEFYDQYPFTIVNFIRIYKNKEVFYLCDNNNWIKDYLLSGLYIQGYFENLTFPQQPELSSWTQFDENDPVVNYSRNLHNVYSGVTYAIPHEEAYCDYFNFGTYLEHHAVATLFRNIEDPIKKFCQNFYRLLKPEISRSERSKISIIQPDLTLVKTEPHKNKKPRIFLGSRFENNNITAREIEVIKFIVRGYSAKKISAVLHIEERTAINHITSIKKKLGVKSLCELGYQVSQLGLDRHWHN